MHPLHTRHLALLLALALAGTACAEKTGPASEPGPWTDRGRDDRRVSDADVVPRPDAGGDASVSEDVSEDVARDVDADAAEPIDAPDVIADTDTPDTDPAPTRGAEDQVLYLVLPDRFANGDTSNDRAGDERCFDPAHPRRFHGGDLAGLRQQLPYLQELGVDTVWTTPLYAQIGLRGESCGYHGYWPDLRDPDDGAIEPKLGDAAALEGLIGALHDRQMRLVLDMVVNHTGYGAALTTQHPDWFHGSNCRELGDPDVYCSLAGLPDLAQEQPVVANYLDAHSRGWVRRFAIDGIRMDTVKHVPVSYFAERWVPTVRAERAGLFIVGEYLADHSLEVYAPYLEAGFDSMFNFRLRTALLTTFAQGGDIAVLANRVHDVIRRFGIGQALRMTNLLDNHDLPRFTEALTGDANQRVRRYHLALAALMTLPGVPQLYYGDELGMLGGTDPDNRRDMPGWAFDASTRQREASGFVGDPAATFDWTARLTALRRSQPALRRGDHFELWRPAPRGPAIYAFLRHVGDELVLVVFNNGTLRSGAFSLPLTEHDSLPPAQRQAFAEGAVLSRILGEGPETMTVDAGGAVALELPALSVGVFVLSPP